MELLLIVGGLCLFLISLMFKTTLSLWVKVLIILVHAVKWTVIVGLLTALLNLPQVYSYFGWTPVSLLMGAEVYDRPLKQLNLTDPCKK